MPSASEPSAEQRAAGHSPTRVPESSAAARIALAHKDHWRRNIRLTLALLVVWAVAGLGCGVLFADTLNQFTFLGFPLGFWFAQQGAIIAFVVVILIYAVTMARFDRRLAREVLAITAEESAS